MGIQRANAPFAVLVALLLVVSPLLGCAAYNAQHAPQPVRAAGSAADAAAPVAPVTEASPEFKRLRSDAQTARVRGEVEEAKRNLAEQGHYSCCIKPACHECLVRRGECHCHDLVAKSTPCGECTQAWIDGRGIVPGVQALDLVKRKQEDAAKAQTAQGVETSPPL